MVCEKCLKKLKEKGGLKDAIVKDAWKDDKDKDKGGLSKARPDPSTRVKDQPYGDKERACKICKNSILTGHYCNTCAFKKGICSNCGKKVADTATEYRGSNK